MLQASAAPCANSIGPLRWGVTIPCIYTGTVLLARSLPSCLCPSRHTLLRKDKTLHKPVDEILFLCTRMCACLRACVHVCARMSVCVRECECECVCVFVCACPRACVCVCVCVRARAYVYVGCGCACTRALVFFSLNFHISSLPPNSLLRCVPLMWFIHHPPMHVLQGILQFSPCGSVKRLALIGCGDSCKSV